MNINLVRDKDTGKSKGFAFICYEDQRSTVLAVDNLNGAKVQLSVLYLFSFCTWTVAFNVLFLSVVYQTTVIASFYVAFSEDVSVVASCLDYFNNFCSDSL